MKTLFIIMILGISLQINSQIIPYGNDFYYNGVIYDKEKIGDVLISNRDAYFNYQQWKNSGNDHTVTIVGGALTLAGFYLTSDSGDENAFESFFEALIGLPIIVGGLTTTLIGVLKSRKNNAYLDYSIGIFNSAEATGFKMPKEDSPKIEIGYTGGKVGLFVTF